MGPYIINAFHISIRNPLVRFPRHRSAMKKPKLPTAYNVRHLPRRKSAACLSLLWLRLLLSGHALSEPGSSAGPCTVVVPPPPTSLNRSLLIESTTDPSMDSESIGCISTTSSAIAKGPFTCVVSTPRIAPSNLPGGTLLAQVKDHPSLQQAGFVVGLTGGAFPRKRGATKAHASVSTSSDQKPPPGSRHPSNSSSSPWPEVTRVLKRCLARAGSGGLPGAAAGVLQVLTLMWMRTVINYQYRYGTSLAAAISELYRQGGVLRFYQGVSFALVSNPLSRFGMAAANEGAMAMRDVLPRPMSVTLTTWVASMLAGVWRVMLTPLDTCKTVLQVEGSKGFALLMGKVWGGNLGCLYQGAVAAAAATAVGYFPWFLTFNYLNARLGRPTAMAQMLVRNAGIGLMASIASDVCSNSIRVLKTTKQASAAYDATVSYRQAASLVIEADGWVGLLGRGLSTRILANGLQSMMFTVVWRYLHDTYVVPWREAAELRDAKSLGGTVGSQRN